MNSAQRELAAALRSLHTPCDGRALVLPNAWDAASAALIARAGARAIATTSAGVSWSAGRPDGHGLTREETAQAVRRIVDVVDVPVSADIEGGYGPGADDVAVTVRAVIAAGAVGVNLEDSLAPGGPLHDVPAQAVRLRAARSATEEAGLADVWINARTDVFLFGIGAPQDRLDAVLRRAKAYAEAGADSLFVPGLVDLDTVAELVRRSPLPVNVMTGPGAPSVTAFEAVGVRRVSVGTALAQTAYGALQRAAAELLDAGTYDAMAGAADFGTVNGAVATER
ncbi:isocitrate lyase/PEP mutase family protein [Streptomyces broussonetiae]|uniref:Isocitrate lyase/phosphoenolpyruvate mutase family protein n=1 Tax=Streptomyces broussonetiae TaxID=2686304 RepID=A0A6I6NII5_9ACTN|nr:isocitrate lyase/phosphoenolpyruvate mutase family protein [Streptomyces broussonetiae]QHA10131.1 isocitrate lyase/phosphoenolpyruvate mutase family protein [Streptomyces broussonetiae]